MHGEIKNSFHRKGLFTRGRVTNFQCGQVIVEIQAFIDALLSFFYLFRARSDPRVRITLHPYEEGLTTQLLVSSNDLL